MVLVGWAWSFWAYSMKSVPSLAIMVALAIRNAPRPRASESRTARWTKGVFGRIFGIFGI